MTLTTVTTDRNKFVDTAIASNSDYIITNDRHFRVLQTVVFPSVRVVRLADFQPILVVHLNS